MVREEFVSSELEAAAQGAELAHAQLRGVAEQSPEYQSALNKYLHATMRYMTIVSVLQARQHELLTEEVAELRAKLNASIDPPGMRPRALH